MTMPPLPDFAGPPPVLSLLEPTRLVPSDPNRPADADISEITPAFWVGPITVGKWSRFESLSAAFGLRMPVYGELLDAAEAWLDRAAPADDPRRVTIARARAAVIAVREGGAADEDFSRATDAAESVYAEGAACGDPSLQALLNRQIGRAHV